MADDGGVAVVSVVCVNPVFTVSDARCVINVPWLSISCRNVIG